KAACYQGSLPQGSPCSPVITNLICNILDVRLAMLAKKLGCAYSRYADDITFSTNKKDIPEELALNVTDGVTLGRKLRNEIERAGFEINDSKTRLSFKPARHEVTGLTVNRFVNVDRRYSKKVRALAHRLYQTGSYTIKNADGE
ncbi:TPA: ribonuclease H, partial [Klebsiella pneumoniae]|nr:ribonuclease H [Klebsiella pneumoniae]